MKRLIKKSGENINKLKENLIAETPKADKKKRNAAIALAILGIGGKIVLSFTPAAPVALASLASELMWAGFGGLGLGVYYQSKKIK